MKDAAFIQEGPELKNPYATNTVLTSILRTQLPTSLFKKSQPELHLFGEKILNTVQSLGRLAETHPPTHIAFDAWGQRVDTIHTHESWSELKNFAAREGLVADGYMRNHAEHSRILQMAKLFLYHPSSAFFSCPLAMTDGAAKVLESQQSQSPVFNDAFTRLTSLDPNTFWTSGQWMTEKTGGSDVSDTSTIATPHKDHFHLSGTKWFSSSTTSEMALALARLEGAESGSKGLSLFFVPMRNQQGSLNNIQVLRLKDKMGTKALPTAELSLNKSKAFLIGEPGKGVKTVASMLNITRLYNAVCSVGQMDRILHLLKNYAEKRQVFQKPLADQILFQTVWIDLKATHFACTALTFEVARLLGREECHLATSEESFLLRLLTPLAKLYTAKKAIEVTSEALEGFGGAGYVENTEIPVLFRDAQVFSIWEGATNVLSLDLLRVLKDPSLTEVFHTHWQKRLDALNGIDKKTHASLKKGLSELNQISTGILVGDALDAQSLSRQWAFALSEVTAAILMAEHIQANSCNQSLAPLLTRWLARVRLDWISERHLRASEFAPFFRSGLI
jgi:putative acyl-CoA dehydrogenase